MKKASGVAALHVRPATKKDVPVLVKLVRDLAQYERLTKEVQTSASSLRLHGFSRRPYFQALVCTRGRRAIGFAVYFFTYSTFLSRPTLYVEDLFVVPEQRGKGAGKALLSSLSLVAVRKGCACMDWAVLGWNTPAIRFYKRLGARLRRQWVLSRLDGNALRNLARAGL